MKLEVEEREMEDGPPPFLGTWPRVYALVAVYLVLVIAGLYQLTQAWAPR
jgi:hypothetical protein